MHSSIRTGDSEFVVQGRRLARDILARRANLPDVNVYSFGSLLDDAWLAYFHRKRVRDVSYITQKYADYVENLQPMFLMGYDGGLPKKAGDELEAARILIQRTFLTTATSEGIPVVLLQPVEFKDSKVGPHRSNALCLLKSADE